MNPHLETQYWISKGTCKEDRDLVKQISEFYGIKYNIENCINPEDNNGYDKMYQDQVYNLLGFNNFVGYGEKKFLIQYHYMRKIRNSLHLEIFVRQYDYENGLKS